MLYRNGFPVRSLAPRSPAPDSIVGQLRTDVHKGVHVLYLMPLEWVHNSTSYGPIATLWRPDEWSVAHGTLLIGGLECDARMETRRWTRQKWCCEILTAQGARDYGKDPRIRGELPPTVTSSPPSDPEDPFG